MTTTIKVLQDLQQAMQETQNRNGKQLKNSSDDDTRYLYSEMMIKTKKELEAVELTLNILKRLDVNY